MKKIKLQFAELESKFEIVDDEEMRQFFGGYMTTDPGTYDPTDPGNCVFNLLCYLSQSSSTTGSSYSPEYYYNLYASQNNPWDFSYDSNGDLHGVTVSTSIMENLMASTLKATSIIPSDLNPTLASGKQVATMLPNQGPNGEGHALVIESYIGGGNYQCYNPSSGSAVIYTGGQLSGTNFLIAIN
ncbi:hypothetical protein [Pedobacter sp. MW01-1-1]|uniref:hypothetical protein n=1 Tax=Pedobacter sp. MW01-1-1 TaxID=3383027 RepID=UPI003FEEC328